MTLRLLGIEGTKNLSGWSDSVNYYPIFVEKQPVELVNFGCAARRNCKCSPDGFMISRRDNNAPKSDSHWTGN